MRRALSALGVLVLVSVSGAAHAQPAASGPRFEAAEVHLRTRTATGSPDASGGVLRGGRYDLRNATMVDLIRTAYRINAPELIVGGPNWLERDRFDIAATAPNSTSAADVQLMLQQLLAERFKLVLHNDTRPVPGVVLTTGKGPHKMKEAAAPGSGCQANPQQPGGGVPMLSGTCKGIAMEQFAQMLRAIAGPYITSPITDQTGLKGYWDFDIHFTPRVALALAGSDAITIFDAVEQQLGLKLDQQRVPTPVIVVDSVNQAPTPNPSGIAANIPAPPPMEFDVAEVKLSKPDTQPRTRLMPGGRIEADGVTMRQLIAIAWDVNMDELLANAPKWIDDTKYSIIAKTATAVSGAGATMNVDIDDLKAMVRALIIERFQLKTHYEDRLVTAYTLISDKPRLTKADPANRTGWKEGPAPDSKDQRTAILGRMITAKNMTMTQFAEDLQRMANGYIRVPVEDKTGLEGAYDFTLAFTPINILNAGRGRGGADPGATSSPAAGASVPASADPTGALSLYDAVNRQLGLKLEMRKRMMPVLVIDHIEEKPVDN
jgi:uncharacterized protein (TIGR03435 family)